MNFYFSLGLVCWSAITSAMQIEWAERPIRIQTEWIDFLNGFRPHMANPKHFLTDNEDVKVTLADAYLKIAPLADIPDTLLLVSNYPAVMNMALLRASIFVESPGLLLGRRAPLIVDGGPIVRNAQLYEAFVHMDGGGQDLRGADLLRFWDAIDKLDRRYFRSVPSSQFDELRPIEAKLRARLEPYLRAHPQTALVAISIHRYQAAVLTHELSHAQYFNNPDYRDAVIRYWNLMPAADRDMARTLLGTNGARYDQKSEDLMINEFQAALTSLNIHLWPHLADLHDPHFALLRAHLMKSLSRFFLIEIPQVIPEPLLSLCNKYLLAAS